METNRHLVHASQHPNNYLQTQKTLQTSTWAITIVRRQDDASIITGDHGMDEDDLNLNFTDDEEGRDNVNNHGLGHEPLPTSPRK